jgi:predicted alpha-1,6-mannanase (GH76 family)
LRFLHACLVVWVALALLPLAACGAGSASPSPSGDASRDALPEAMTADSGVADASGRDAQDGADSTLAPADATAEAADGQPSSAESAAPESGADAGADAAYVATLQAGSASALQSLLLSYWSGTQSYMVDTPGGSTLAGYWIFAQTFDALLDGVERTGGEHYKGLVETFYESQKAIGFSRNFYDDENWMTLALMRAYDLTGDPAYLTEATTLYTDIMSGWDTTCCGSTPGGIWWDKPHTQKATASNAGPVIAGVRLSERTSDPSYLAFAKQVYAFWTTNMIDPTTHEVIDHIDANGTLVRYKFTYDEGLVLGASAELYRVTQDPQYTTLAALVQGFMLASETKASGAGTVLTDGTNSGCTGDCAQFKGIGYRYLDSLYRQTLDPAALALLSSSAAAIWQLARDPASTRFATDWAGPSIATPTLEADSSATMALALFAELSGPYVSDGSLAAGVLQAEEGTLHSVGLEALHAGFDGWGYVAGWNADGQWVDFHYDAAAAGNYTLTLRYEAGAGNASRLLFVNGQNAVPNQAFASTASWSTYASVVATVPLVAGSNTISVIYNSSLGSSNYLNLDQVQIQP